MTIKHLPEFEFSDQGGSDDEGYNDPVRTHFDRNIASSVSRESIQNVIDARDPNLRDGARVEFSLLLLEPKTIPGRNSLKKHLEACARYFDNSEDAKRFTENGLLQLGGTNPIPVLKISDYNTVGLTGGDSDRNGNYCNFMKAAGATNKVGNTGGSFGLGKGALFAASAFSTIFVRSRFTQGKTVGHVFQGKCRFMSHKIGKTVYRAVGSYGLPGQKAVRNAQLIPPGFERQENGTDVYVVGMRNHQSWSSDILVTVLHNFWRAIQTSVLAEVVVDKQSITAKNLAALMRSNFDETTDGTDDVPNPLPYFLAMTESQKQRSFEKTFETLGKVQCFLMPQEKFPNRVACFRQTGMLIQLKQIQSPLVRYSGVFLCENDKGNEILKKLEPPSHDKWDKNSSNAKMPDGKTRRDCSAADREFVSFVRDCVKTLSESGDKKQLAVGGLEDYLNLPADDDDELIEAFAQSGSANVKPVRQETGTEGAYTDNQIPPVPPTRQLQVLKPKDGATDTPGDAVIPGGREQNSDDRKPPPDSNSDDLNAGSDTGEIKVRGVSGATSRSFAANDTKLGMCHIVIVRGGKKVRCHLRVLAGTDNSYESIVISDACVLGSATSLVVVDNFIKDVCLDENGVAKVRVKFAGDEQYALNVGIYEDL